jgi:hypothetical protein
MDGGPAPLPSAQALQSWTSGAKDLVMTALGSSRVWATTGQGIFGTPGRPRSRSRRPGTPTALGYLAGRQRQDGSWPRCFFVSRVSAAFDPQAAVQLDEVAFPLLLAGKLDELGVPMPEGADNAITSAAGYLARNGPVSSQDVDRWEGNAGASPSTSAWRSSRCSSPPLG